MMPMTPPSTATPIPMYAQVMVDMPRTVTGSAMVRKLLIGVMLVVSLTSCATAKRAGTAGKVAVVDCGKPALAPAAALLARWAVEDAMAGKIQWSAHEQDALGVGLGVGTCAYAEFRRAYKAKPTVQALATGPAPDDGSAGLARLRAKLGGAEIRLADGSVM